MAYPNIERDIPSTDRPHGYRCRCGQIDTTFNTAIRDTATEVLAKYQSKKKQWMTDDILAQCNERRKLKKQMKESDSTSEYRK